MEAERTKAMLTMMRRMEGIVGCTERWRNPERWRLAGWPGGVSPQVSRQATYIPS